MKKTMFLFTLMMAMLLCVGSALAAFNTPSSGQTINTNAGQTLNVTCTSTNNLNVTFVGTGLPAAVVVANTSAAQTTFTYSSFDPAINEVGRNKVLYAYCSNATALYVENHSVTFNIWDYEPTEMANVGVDVVGSAGVTLKTYVPLIILVLILSMAAGTWAALKRLKK